MTHPTAAVCSPLQLSHYNSLITVKAEAVYAFMNMGLVGGIWGMVTPFPPPGAPPSAGGIIRAFSSLSAVGHNAPPFAAVAGVQRLSSRGLELVRGRADLYNDLFGMGVTVGYIRLFFWGSDRRAVFHNRVVGGAVLACLAYANLADIPDSTI